MLNDRITGTVLGMCSRREHTFRPLMVTFRGENEYHFNKRFDPRNTLRYTVILPFTQYYSNKGFENYVARKSSLNY